MLTSKTTVAILYFCYFSKSFYVLKEMSTQPIARGYARVSTTLQSDDGVSLETQAKRIQAHCAYKGYNLVKIYEDRGISGKDMNRPSLKQLIDDLNKGDFVICCDLSRFSRNTKDALTMLQEFDNKGAHFVCLNPDLDFSTPYGRAMFTILMAFHQLERQNISANVSMNMQRISKEGKLRGRAPFGWKFIGKDSPSQQAVLNKIKLLHAAGMKMGTIAKKLNEDGDNQQ